MVRKHDPDAAHLRVRLDGKLRRQLEQAAKRNNRSTNSEIVDRLERSFAHDTESLIKQAAETALARTKDEIHTLILSISGPPTARARARGALFGHRCDHMKEEELEEAGFTKAEARTFIPAFERVVRRSSAARKAATRKSTKQGEEG
jgi:Arc-like DNA binding domain